MGFVDAHCQQKATHRTMGAKSCLRKFHNCPTNKRCYGKLLSRPIFIWNESAVNHKVWEIFLDMDEESHNDDVSVFMAVPTIYAKLINEYHNMGDKLDNIDIKQKIQSKIRLMVSGSAHMPDVRNIIILNV